MTAKLLIVDDEPDSIRLMGRMLHGAGDLFFATSGAMAVSTAMEKRPDIVLLDAEMPGMDGFEVCQALKKNPATAGAAIIFVTAHCDLEHETRALRLGAIDFISKPISPPIVRARVRNHLTLKAQADELRHLAATDPLTGLANRRTFDRALEEEWRRARRGGHPLALAMLDIDHFKNYNDAHGHPAGDRCLQAVAKLLGDNVLRSGEVVARFGGEEFVLLLPETPLRSAVKLGDRLCGALQALELRHGNSPVSPFVTVSVGVASLRPGSGPGPEALLVAADGALYEAKRAGKNRVAWQVGNPVTASAVPLAPALA